MNEAAKTILLRGAAELGLQLTSAQLGNFYTYAGELTKWSKKINLTAIRTDEDIALKHFIDSLTVAKVVKNRGKLLDLGSGGGFPAIPLKILFHELQIVSVDAVEKKVIFQRHVARLLHLHGFDAVHARGEELVKSHVGQFDWIVSRAFSDIPTFVAMALPLLKPDGRIIAMKGRGGREEGEAAKGALDDLGGRIVDMLEFRLPVSGDARYIVLIGRAEGS